MSHELRTPINAILGFGQVMEMDRDPPLAPRHRDFMAQIVASGRHLPALFNDLLDLARIEAGRLELAPEPIDLCDSINGALDMVRPLATEREVSLAVAGLDHPRFATADPMRVKQVLHNLLSNAVKYNRQGGAVTVEAGDGGAGLLRISVIDTGIGAPPALREKLFRPFDRLGAERSGIQGTGISLAISRELVERMGGPLDFAPGPKAAPCSGSSFRPPTRRAPRAPGPRPGDAPYPFQAVMAVK